MIWPFKRTRPVTVSKAGQALNAVQRKNKRERYKQFHNDMAASVGRTIKWAD